MADRLKIEGNFLVIFEDGTPSNEYIRHPRARVTYTLDSSDNFSFYAYEPSKSGEVNAFLLGNRDFDGATIIDDRTGVAFASISELKTYLSKETGFFFSQQETNYAQRIDEKTTAKTVYVGKAPIGSLPSDPVWQLKRISDVTTTTIITWADGNDNYDNVWDDRASLTYS